MKLFGGFKNNKGLNGNSNHSGWDDEALKFKVIVESIEDGVVLIDKQKVIRLFNPAAETITGWKAEDANGIDVTQVINLITDKGDAYDADQNPFNIIFNAGESIPPAEPVALHFDKQQVPINLNVSPLLDDDQNVTAAVAIFSNVSAQRAAEKQRADFISTASHEMRTPVAAIEGYLALALNEKVATIDTRARDYLQKAHSSTQHLGQLFQDLLTSAQAEDGRISNHPKVFELGGFLEELSEGLRLVAEKKGLDVEFSSATSNTINATSDQGSNKVVRPLYYVYADQDRMREVVTNLFDNAVKYTPSGKITMGVTGNDQVAQCFVKDTGPGIAAEDIPHLFQKFYRVDNSATRTIGGTGLGLFICRKIVELYNGRIWAESELGKGTGFYINLPRLSSQKAQAIEQGKASPPIAKPLNEPKGS